MVQSRVTDGNGGTREQPPTHVDVAFPCSRDPAFPLVRGSAWHRRSYKIESFALSRPDSPSKSIRGPRILPPASSVSSCAGGRFCSVLPCSCSEILDR